MVPTVKAHPIDLTVYGIRQVDYTMDGESGFVQFNHVIAESSFQQAATVDQQTQAVASALRLRQHKTDDLSRVLALLDGILCSFKTKNPTSSDKSEYWLPNSQKDDLLALLDRVSKYGNTVMVSLADEIKKGCGKSEKRPNEFCVQITRGTAMHSQSEIERMIDTENTNIQQEMNTLQGFVTKRDKAYKNAAKVIEKYDRTASSVIKAMM